MRNLIIALVCSLTLGTVSVALSSPAQKGKGNKAQQGQKKNGQKGKGGQGRMDPSAMAARMIQQFDKNGDKSLNVRELTTALTTMRERRGQAGKGGMGKGKGGGPAKGKAGQGKGKGKGKKGLGKGDTGGGVKPKKPGN